MTVLVLLFAACKTVDDEPVQLQAAPEALPALSQPAVEPATPEVVGYDRDGASTCLPLPEGRTCIRRPDRLVSACAAAGGDTLVCEDCATLCSRPLTVQ